MRFGRQRGGSDGRGSQCGAAPPRRPGSPPTLLPSRPPRRPRCRRSLGTCPLGRTGLVGAPGSAGVALKSLLPGKRTDVVPPSPRLRRKSASCFPWAPSQAETELREPRVCKTGRRSGPASVETRSQPPASAAAPPGSPRESEPGVPRRWKPRAPFPARARERPRPSSQLPQGTPSRGAPSASAPCSRCLPAAAPVPGSFRRRRASRSGRSRGARGAGHGLRPRARSLT